MFWVIQALESNAGIKLPAAIELIVIKYTQYDCGDAYLFRNTDTPPYGAVAKLENSCVA